MSTEQNQLTTALSKCTAPYKNRRIQTHIGLTRDEDGYCFRAVNRRKSEDTGKIETVDRFTAHISDINANLTSIDLTAAWKLLNEHSKKSSSVAVENDALRVNVDGRVIPLPVLLFNDPAFDEPHPEETVELELPDLSALFQATGGPTESEESTAFVFSFEGSQLRIFSGVRSTFAEVLLDLERPVVTPRQYLVSSFELKTLLDGGFCLDQHVRLELSPTSLSFVNKIGWRKTFFQTIEFDTANITVKKGSVTAWFSVETKALSRCLRSIGTDIVTFSANNGSTIRLASAPEASTEILLRVDDFRGNETFELIHLLHQDLEHAVHAFPSDAQHVEIHGNEFVRVMDASRQGSAMILATVTPSRTVLQPFRAFPSACPLPLFGKSNHPYVLQNFLEMDDSVWKNPDRFLEEMEKTNNLDKTIMLDKGAFLIEFSESAKQRVEKDWTYYIESANKFCLHPGIKRICEQTTCIDRYSATVSENLTNWLYDKKAGVDAILVMHEGESWSLLREALHTYKPNYVGFGGSAMSRESERLPYDYDGFQLLREVYGNQLPSVHLFGQLSFGSEALLLRHSVPQLTADSTSWNQAAQAHLLYTPFGTLSLLPNASNFVGKHPKINEIDAFVRSLSYDRAPYGRFDFTFESLKAKAEHRQLFNLAFLTFFQRFIDKMGWMRHEGRFISENELIQYPPYPYPEAVNGYPKKYLSAVRQRVPTNFHVGSIL